MKGWFNQAYRHSLARRGISTSFRYKSHKLMIEGGRPLGWGSKEFMKWLKEKNPEEYEKMKKKVEERNRKVAIRVRERVAKEKALKETIGVEEFNRLKAEKDSVRLKRIFEEEFPGATIAIVPSTIRPEDKVTQEEEEDEDDEIFFGGEGRGNYGGKMAFVTNELGTELSKSSPNKVKVGQLREDLRDIRKTNMSAKTYDFIGDKDGDPVNFINDNLRATEDHSLDKWWSSVKYTLVHPFKDADGEWIEYNMIAGNKNVLLSKDKAERAEQRGAAIFARVASQANMEPLIERGKNRTFRQIVLDLEFGRRTGDENDDKLLIDGHSEK